MPCNYPPKFTRHQQDWTYSISNEQRVDLKCSRNNTWISTSLRFHGNGILRNASSCYIVGQNFQLYPTVHGHSTTTVTQDEQLVIHHVNPISLEEQQILLSSPTPNTSEVDHISAGVDTMKIRSLDNILQIHETNIQKCTQYYSYMYILIPSLVTALCIMISCYGKPFWIPYIRRILPCTKKPQSPKPTKITPRTNPRMEVEAEISCSSDDHIGPETGNMQFVTYGAQSTEWKLRNIKIIQENGVQRQYTTFDGGRQSATSSTQFRKRRRWKTAWCDDMYWLNSSGWRRIRSQWYV
jgi:hypothetical protein